MSDTTTTQRVTSARDEDIPLGTDTRLDTRAGRRALSDLLRPVRGPLWIGRILAVGSAVLGVFPFVALVAIGNHLTQAWSDDVPPDRVVVHGALMLLLGTFTGRLFVYFLALMSTHLADVVLVGSIRARLVERLGGVPLAWFSANTSGHVRKVLQDDVQNLHMLVAHRPVDMVSSIAVPIALATYTFIIDWRLGVLTIACVPVYLVVYGFFMLSSTDRSLELDRRLDRVSASMVEFVTGIQVVKAFGITGKAHHRYARAAEEAVDFIEEWNGPMVNASALTSAIASTPMIVLLTGGVGTWMTGRGWVTPVEVVVACLAAITLPNSINQVTSLSWNYQMAGAAAARILAVLNLPVMEVPGEPGPVPADCEVRLEGVSVSYGQTVALDDVDLTLAPGTLTALIGPSGAGKSTLAGLVARFRDPDAGTVRLGGVDLREMTTEQLYSRVAFVLQDAQILRASVHDNIALGRPGASRAEVEQAARRARVHDEIKALPRGYDTVLGSETRLSGGQEQRIGIARALLLDAPVLILDEAVAMVDPECEARLQEAVSELVVGRTVLVIDHRPASVRDADQIVLLDRGRVVAAGTHEEIEGVDLYQRLLRASSSQGATTSPVRDGAAAAGAVEASRQDAGRPRDHQRPRAVAGTQNTEDKEMNR